jgi:hypothetical protein
MCGNMEKSIVAIGQSESLDEFLQIIEKACEFEHFLLATSHFVRGEPSLELCGVSEFVDDTLVSLATNTLVYATNLAANYTGETPYDLFSKSLRATVRFSEERREHYIKWFNDLLNIASKDDVRKEIFLDLVQEVLQKRNGHYALEYERQSNHADGNYKSLVHSQRKDVVKFLTYAQGKLENGDPSISYNDCFEVKGDEGKTSGTKGEKVKLTDADVLAAAGSGKITSLIKKFGVCALAHHGKNGPGAKTITVYFSNGSGEESVAVRYNERLPTAHIDFYKTLCDAVQPPNNDLIVLTGKTRRFLIDY